MTHVNHKQSVQAIAAATLGEKTERLTGNGALSFTLQVESRTKILSFRLGATAVPVTSANLILSVQNPALGSEFSCTVLTADMDGAASVFYNEPMFLEPGDVFRAEWTNADSVSWGLAVVYADLGAE